MEWLVLFGAIAIVVGAVVWLAGRALRRRPRATDATEDAGGRLGPRQVDVAAMEARDSDDASP
ncbi:MAG TPA: hypothetical protein VM253_05350 [Candidatus Limnocylindrales bacterium]|jgi:uncharacterized membrane protein|nr:hypothetical protein [Candidatus Limnocylindrales bacterium]